MPQSNIVSKETKKINSSIVWGKEVIWQPSDTNQSVLLVHKLGYNVVPCRNLPNQDRDKKSLVGWLGYESDRLQRVILEEWLAKKWKDTDNGNPLWFLLTGPSPLSNQFPLCVVDADDLDACKMAKNGVRRHHC